MKKRTAPVLTYTIFDAVWAEDKKEYKDASWDDVVARVEKPATAISKKALKLISLCEYGDLKSDKGIIRHAANVKRVFGIEFDYDLEAMTLDAARVLIEQAAVEALLYTSPSHTPEKPRWRALFPFSAAVPPEQRRDMVGRANRILQGGASNESFTLSQCFYIGKVKGAVYETAVVHGTRMLNQAIDILPLAYVDPKKAKKTTPGTDAASSSSGDSASTAASSRDTTTDAELRESFIKGESRYQSMLKLSSRWAARGLKEDDIAAALYALFDEAQIPPKNKDGINLRKRVANMARTAFKKYGETRSDPIADDDLPEPDDSIDLGDGDDSDEAQRGVAEAEGIDQEGNIGSDGNLAEEESTAKDAPDSSAQKPIKGAFGEGPPCLQHLALNGFTKGVYKDGLFAIGVYLKKRYPDEWQSKIWDYNKKYLNMPDEKVKEAIKGLKKKDYNYSCNKLPLQPFCNKTLCRNRTFGVGDETDGWNIEIGAPVECLMMSPPTWVVPINSIKIKMMADDFLSQALFIKKCMEHIHYKPLKLSESAWTDVVNTKILAVAIKVEVPPDASIGGQLLDHLEQFCTVFTQAETREEILTGKPFSEMGYTYFRSSDFMQYLDAKKFKAPSRNWLFAQLRDVGMTYKQLWVGTENVRVWVVPEFPKNRVEMPARQVAEQGGV